MSNAFGEFCNEHGIERQHTMRNRPQQNGVAERVNRTLKEGITAMLQEAHLPPSFWREALHTLVYTLNRTPRSANPGITPYEAFFGVKPDVSDLRIFGSLAYVHVRMSRCLMRPKCSGLHATEIAELLSMCSTEGLPSIR